MFMYSIAKIESRIENFCHITKRPLSRIVILVAEAVMKEYFHEFEFDLLSYIHHMLTICEFQTLSWNLDLQPIKEFVYCCSSETIIFIKSENIESTYWTAVGAFLFFPFS